MTISPRMVCVDLLADMVRIDSINAEISGRPRAEQELGDYMEAQARAFGLTTRRIPVLRQADNLLVTCQKDDGAPWLLFESHLDTIGIDGMSIEPFAACLKDGALHGRGACDTKGSGAAMLTALKAYADRSSGCANVALLLTVDEEVSRSGIDTFVLEELNRLSWRPVGAIVGEPTGLRLVSAHRGDVRFTISTKGVAAHSSDPARGRSAIRMMLPVLTALETRYIPGLKASHPLTGRAVCSINQIRGGSQINVIPESCEIRIDRRTVPGEDVDRIVREIEALLGELRESDPDLDVSIHDLHIHEALDPTLSLEYAARLAGILVAMNLPGDPIGVGYGSHASTLASVGIPSVVFGPGDIAQAHSADEWLKVDQLNQAADVYLAIMQGVV